MWEEQVEKALVRPVFAGNFRMVELILIIEPKYQQKRNSEKQYSKYTDHHLINTDVCTAESVLMMAEYQRRHDCLCWSHRKAERNAACLACWGRSAADPGGSPPPDADLGAHGQGKHAGPDGHALVTGRHRQEAALSGSQHKEGAHA